MPEWTLAVGEKIKRKQLHDDFGGSRQSGISPSTKTPNVFLFTDPASGEQHGYFDRWADDGLFHYTGEGQHGDQQMTKGNLAILEAQGKGRALRVFNGTGGPVEYRGQFQLDPKESYYEATALQTGGGATRKVIIFRLRPLDTLLPNVASTPPLTEAKVTDIPVEENNTERTVVDPAPEPYEAQRREAALVQQFKLYMESRSYTVRRNEIVPPGETSPIRTDVYVKELNLLIEAKGSIDRNSIRMAIGQLFDYKRFIIEASVRCAILLPELPRPDLLRLLASIGILIYIPEKGEFVLMDGDGHRL